MFLGMDENKRGLKAVLENKKILKLIHDCRNDWDSLLHQYSVRIYNFIDTQEAYFVFKLFYYQEITLPISLLKFIEMMTKVKLEYKEKFKNVMSEDPYMWSTRPLSEEQLAYASEDVVFLIKAWLNLKDKFNENLREIIFFLTILKVVDTNMFDQFREYLIANIIYFGMLENVFSSTEVYAYIFAVDYVYNFLQIKIISEKGRGEEGQGPFPHGNNNLLPDEHYYKFVKDQKTSESIIKFGLNFKEKQRILSLKQFKDEEMIMMEKFNCEGWYNYKSPKKEKFNRERSCSFENTSSQKILRNTQNLEEKYEKTSSSPTNHHNQILNNLNSPKFCKNPTNEEIFNNIASNGLDYNEISHGYIQNNYSNIKEEGSSPKSDGFSSKQNFSIYNTNNYRQNFSNYSSCYEKNKNFHHFSKNNFYTKNQYSYGNEFNYGANSTNFKHFHKKEYYKNISTNPSTYTENKMTSCIFQNNENKFYKNKNFKNIKNHNLLIKEEEILINSQPSSGEEQQKSVRSTEIFKDSMVVVENKKRHSHEITHTPIKNNKKPKYFYHYNQCNNQKRYQKNKKINHSTIVETFDMIPNLDREIKEPSPDGSKMNRKISF
jgi:hypothetical protein